MADAHSAADDAASAALLTARWAVPLKRSTCDAALSAIRSVVCCAVCAYVFNFGARWIRTATGATVTAPHWRGSIHINSFLKKYATGNPIGAAVAFAVALSVFQPVATISGSLISS